MGVSESTHLLLHHPALRLGAPTNVGDTAEGCPSGDQHPAIDIQRSTSSDQPGLPQRYRAQPGRPAGIRTRIASFGGMCPVQLSDRPEMKWYGRKDSNLHVSAFVAQCPVQLNDARIAKWFRDQGSNLEPAGSEPADLPIDLSRNGGEARNRTENRWNQNPLLCQFELPPNESTANKNGVTDGNRTHVGCSTDIRLNHSATVTFGAWSWNRANLCSVSDCR